MVTGCAFLVPKMLAVSVAQGAAVTLVMAEVLVAAVLPLVTAMPMHVVEAIEIVRLLPNWVHELPLVE